MILDRRTSPFFVVLFVLVAPVAVPLLAVRVLSWCIPNPSAVFGAIPSLGALLVLRRWGWVELRNAEPAEHLGDVFVSAGDAGLAALLAGIDLDGADCFQGLPGERSGQVAARAMQILLQGAIQ